MQVQEARLREPFIPDTALGVFLHHGLDAFKLLRLQWRVEAFSLIRNEGVTEYGLAGHVPGIR